MITSKKLTIFFILSLFLFFILALLFGSVKSPNSYIITKIRLPRIIGAVVVGACLASSGLVFQSVFKNPMADSYMLGISSSASFFVCLALLLFQGLSKSISLGIFSIIGSILCTIILFSISKNNTFSLLLTGIALNFLFSSATTLLIYLNRKQLDTILFWTMGSLSSLTWTKIILISSITIISILIEYKERYTLDLLLFNDETARSSGIDVENKKTHLLVIASISTAVVVAFCGVIGFVGMISAHIVRLILGPSHKNILIPSTLLGSIFLIVADLISRTIIAPSELPIGIISSICGAPILLILVNRNKTWIK